MAGETLWSSIEINKAEKMANYDLAIEKARWELFLRIWYEQSGELYFNKAYFTNGEHIDNERINQIIEEANINNQKLEDIKAELENDNILNQAQKNLIKNRLEKIILNNEYHKNAIYIEAEKAGYKLSNKDRIKYRKRIIELENILYGPSITDIPERKQKVIDKLHQLYKDNNNELNNELNDEEKTFWEENIIEKYQKETSIEKAEKEDDKEDIFIKDESVFDIMKLLLEIEGFDKHKLTNIQISDTIEGILKKDIYFIPRNITEEEIDDYFKKENINKDTIIIKRKDSSQAIEKQEDSIYFVSNKITEENMDSYFKTLGIENNLKIIKKISGNNSVSIIKEWEENWENKFKKNCIYLKKPIKDKYSLKESILPVLFDHEIGAHVKMSMGNIHNANIKDPDRTDLEEWIALLNQRMAKWESLEDLYEASIGDIRMFMAEQFDDDDLRKLLTIYYKLTKAKDPNIDDWIKRVRMGVPIWEKGSRKKDLTYGNAKENIRSLEKLSKTDEWRKIVNKYAKVIYSTGIGFEWLENIDEIMEGIKDVNDLEPEFPIFAGKILYRKLFKGKLDKDKMLESDVRNIIETNKNVTLSQKKLLIKILHVIEENSIK